MPPTVEAATRGFNPFLARRFVDREHECRMPGVVPQTKKPISGTRTGSHAKTHTPLRGPRGWFCLRLPGSGTGSACRTEKDPHRVRQRCRTGGVAGEGDAAAPAQEDGAAIASTFRRLGRAVATAYARRHGGTLNGRHGQRADGLDDRGARAADGRHGKEKRCRLGRFGHQQPDRRGRRRRHRQGSRRAPGDPAARPAVHRRHRPRRPAPGRRRRRLRPRRQPGRRLVRRDADLRRHHRGDRLQLSARRHRSGPVQHRPRRQPGAPRHLSPALERLLLVAQLRQPPDRQQADFLYAAAVGISGVWRQSFRRFPGAAQVAPGRAAGGFQAHCPSYAHLPHRRRAAAVRRRGVA